jgi:hypothetical protein
MNGRMYGKISFIEPLQVISFSWRWFPGWRSFLADPGLVICLFRGYSGHELEGNGIARRAASLIPRAESHQDAARADEPRLSAP